MGNQPDNGVFELNQGIAFYQQQNYMLAVMCFSSAAEKGNLAAMNNLSVLNMNGQGTPKDETLAFEWMKKAAENGYAPSYYPLACKYYDGVGVQKDWIQAKRWAEKTVQFGNEQDKINAEKMLKIISQANTSPAGVEELQRGMNYYRARKYEQAYQCFLDSAAKGYHPAMNNLSIMHVKGQGVPVDLEQSFIWMKKAAEAGYAPSFYPLASKYYFGKGTAKDFEQAEFWARKTANAAVADTDKQNAQKMISELERIKKGSVPQSKPQDHPYQMKFSAEAAQDFRDSCDLYNKGQYAQALNKLEKLGRLGHPGALRVIGQAYLDGKGVTVNVSHAYKFLSAAAFRGDELAVRFIAKRLNGKSEYGVWKAYAQNLHLPECDGVLTQGIIHERNRTDTYVKANDARDAMLNAADCWNNYKRYPNRSERGLGRSATAAYYYFNKAACFGNVDALCGKSMFCDMINRDAHFEEMISAYRVAAYCGHSYAMYRIAQHYDLINKKAADACYLQAARWGYQPARFVCDQRGLTV